jgi:SAM-dependent methyltransferase
MPNQDNFYYRLEQRFRGSREEIGKRLQAYLPIIEPLKNLYPTPRALDLGCGRGEWLELASSRGYDAYGVDTDDGMLDFCNANGLSVSKSDAVNHLRSIPASSLALVTGFHIVEHMEFEAIRTLVEQARRVLMPAGLLILETPNPENLVVSTCNFYIDPTHRNPLPPELLRFLGQDSGFTRCKIFRLNHSGGAGYPKADGPPSISGALGTVSPDYSLVAQTSAEQHVADAFDWFSEPEDNRTLGAALEEYDKNLVRLIGENKRQLREARVQLVQKESELGAAMIEVTQRQEQLRLVYASRSWRITGPLRAISYAIRRIKDLLLAAVFPSALKDILKRCIRGAIRFALNRPKLKAYGLARLRRFPALKDRLRAFASSARSIRRPHSHGHKVPVQPDDRAIDQIGSSDHIRRSLADRVSAWIP